MQHAVECDEQDHSNYAMCVVNPSHVGKTFDDTALREIVDTILHGFSSLHGRLAHPQHSLVWLSTPLRLNTRPRMTRLVRFAGSSVLPRTRKRSIIDLKTNQRQPQSQMCLSKLQILSLFWWLLPSHNCRPSSHCHFQPWYRGCPNSRHRHPYRYCLSEAEEATQ